MKILLFLAFSFFLAACEYPDLRDEILAMSDKDQEARFCAINGSTLWDDVGYIDGVHLPKLKEIIAAHGWPGHSKIGEDGSHAMWLLVQHADSCFQEEVLVLLREAVSRGEASPTDLAYLTDRVLCHKGHEQLYGTQAFLEEGEMQFYPIALVEEVDKRREKLGLPSLDEYKRILQQVYASEELE